MTCIFPFHQMLIVLAHGAEHSWLLLTFFCCTNLISQLYKSI